MWEVRAINHCYHKERPMRRSYLLCAGVLVLLMLFVAPGVAAIPSFLGYTGLILTPTADVLSQSQWNAGFFAFDFDALPDASSFCANLGVAPTVEVGFARTRLSDSEEAVITDGSDGVTVITQSGAAGTILNGKYQFLSETPAHPALAAGIIDLTGDVKTTVYAVASKSFGQSHKTAFGEITSARFHAGVGGGLLDGLFGAVSAALGDRLFLMLEYTGDGYNAGARFSVTDEWHVHFAGLDWFDNLGIGVSFNKGF